MIYNFRVKKLRVKVINDISESVFNLKRHSVFS